MRHDTCRRHPGGPSCGLLERAEGPRCGNMHVSIENVSKLAENCVVLTCGGLMMTCRMNLAGPSSGNMLLKPRCSCSNMRQIVDNMPETSCRAEFWQHADASWKAEPAPPTSMKHSFLKVGEVESKIWKTGSACVHHLLLNDTKMAGRLPQI